MSNFELFARSDVARDIEQNSAYFTSVGKSVYEYVSNSVDYCKPGARVEVHVTRSRGKLTVRKHRTVKYSGIVVEETKNGGGLAGAAGGERRHVRPVVHALGHDATPQSRRAETAQQRPCAHIGAEQPDPVG